ncbi:MAG: hypothetical protein IIX85_07625 [Clostridia bacterium]|nr:hypothetical protein [Clostridia bacterium]
MDLYTEQLYRKRKPPLEFLLQTLIFVGCVVGSVLIIMIFSALSKNFGFMAGTLIVAILAYFSFKDQWFQRFDREYEYLYFNGDVDIDRITAKSTRKRILSVRAADVLRFGTYRESIKTNVPFDKIIDVTSGFETENTICFMTLRHKEHGNVLLIFEPKKEILDDLKRRVQVPFEA